jgi:hypothetical protein
MVDINTELMKEYEIEIKDSYVNCVNDSEIIDFLSKYISWLENKINSEKNNNLNELKYKFYKDFEELISDQYFHIKNLRETQSQLHKLLK